MSKKRILTDEEKEKIQESKEELKRYRKEIKYIQEKEDDIEETKAFLERTTTRLSKTKTSNNSITTDKFSDQIDKINKIDKEIPNRLAEMLEMKLRIDEKIDKLEYPERDVLFMRYSRGQNWKYIINALGLESERRVYQIHGDALYNYSKL